MLNLAPHIKLVSPPTKPIYPYSNSLYIEDDISIIIDAGTGQKAYNELSTDKIQMILLTHFHFDHVHSTNMFPHADLYASQEDCLNYSNYESYIADYGYNLWDEFMSNLERKPYNHIVPIPDDIPVMPGFRNIKLTGTFQDMQIIDAGHYQIQAIHLPGHTQGHYGFYIEKVGLLFSGDINPSFCSWYTNNSSSIAELIYSLNKIIELNPALVLPSHSRAFDKDLIPRIEKQIQIILDRNALIYDLLQTPHTIDALTQHHIIFPKHNNMYELFWEKIGIRNHIHYLLDLKLIKEIETNLYCRF